MYYNKEKVDKDEAEVLLWQKMLEPYDKCGRLDIDACMESFMPYLEANRVRINNPEQCRHTLINRKLRLTHFLDILRNNLIAYSQR